MIKFYFNTAPNPVKVALMLEELGLDYEAVPVDTRKGEQHAAGFLKVNPNAKVPAIDDDGTVVFDSGAITLYLAQKHAQFLPTDSKAMGEMLSWHFFVSSGIGPYSGQAVHFTRVAPDEAYAKNRYTKEIARHYNVLNDRLGASPYLGGAEYSIADITLWGWVRAAGFVFGADDALAAYPHVKAWFDEVNARPAVERVNAMLAKHTFKTENDEEAMRAMFPQNY